MSPPADTEFDVASRFDGELSGAPADERVYRVALQLYEPARVADVADRAGCAPDTARRHLQRLAEIGVVERITDDPATYRRNEPYFEWRERQRLANLSMDELQERLETLTERERTFRDRYDAESPSDVDVLADADIEKREAVWLDLGEWETVRRRLERLEAVRQRRASESLSDSEVA